MRNTILFLCLLLNGCAAVQYSKSSDVWAKKDQIIGMPAENLLACAGEPMQLKTDESKTAHLLYGIENIMSSASAWCVIDFQIDNLKVTKIKQKSNNPGGLSDGQFSCAFIVDPCIGDGKLADIPIPGSSIRKLKGDPEVAALAAQGTGERLRNEGIFSILTMMAAPPTSLLQLATRTAPDFVDPDQKASALKQLQQLQQLERVQPAGVPAKLQKPQIQGQHQTSPAQTSAQNTSQRTDPVVTAYEPSISVGASLHSAVGNGNSVEGANSEGVCRLAGNTIAGIQDEVACRCRKSGVPGARVQLIERGASCVTKNSFVLGCVLSSSGQKTCTAL